MIEQKTGTIVVGNERIACGITEVAFLKTKIGQTARCSPQGIGWVAYSGIGDDKFTYLLRFYDGRFIEAQIVPMRSSSLSWRDWSEELEQALVLELSRVLTDWLGPVPHQFGWGEATVTFDQRMGATVIIVRYRMRNSV